MAYKQKSSPFKQTINVTSKILSKEEAAQAKAEEREEVKKNKKKKKKKDSPLDEMVKMPGKVGKNAKMVKLPGTAGRNPLDGMVKF